MVVVLIITVVTAISSDVSLSGQPVSGDPVNGYLNVQAQKQV